MVPYDRIILNIQFEIREPARSVVGYVSVSTVAVVGAKSDERRTEGIRSGVRDFAMGPNLMLILSLFVWILDCLRVILQHIFVFQRPGKVSIAVNFTEDPLCGDTRKMSSGFSLLVSLPLTSGSFAFSSSWSGSST